MLSSSSRRAALPGLTIVVLASLLVSEAHGQQRVRVPGDELRRWFSTYSAIAGDNADNGCAFIVVTHSLSRRDQYFDCGSVTSAVWKGTARIVGDELCSRGDGDPQERCSLVHRIGPDKYEMREGAIEFYKLR